MPDELYNWIVEVTVDQASVLLWVTGCSTGPEAQEKARGQAVDLRAASGPVTVSAPVNMGVD